MRCEVCGSFSEDAWMSMVYAMHSREKYLRCPGCGTILFASDFKYVLEFHSEQRGNGQNYIKGKDGKFEGSRPGSGSGSISGKETKKTSDEKSKKSIDNKSKNKYNKNDEISALGVNKFDYGFTQKVLDAHWGGSSDHSGEYEGFTKEQYAQRALELVQSAADNKYIFGYKTSDGTVVRYDIRTNDFVKGHPHNGIYTMFKPKGYSNYFHRMKKKDGGIVK